MINASLWSEGTSISGNTKSVEESFVADGETSIFTLTDFTYVVGTGAMAVFLNGVRQVKNGTWGEISESQLYLTGAEEGDVVTAVAHVGITGEVVVEEVVVEEDDILDIATYYLGVVAGDVSIFNVVLATAVTFATDFAGSQAFATTATDGYDLTIGIYRLEGDIYTTLGTLTFSDGVREGTFTSEDGADLEFAVGGVICLWSDSIADEYNEDTLEDIAVTLQANVGASDTEEDEETPY